MGAPVGDHTCYFDHAHTGADQIAALKEEVADLRKDRDRLAKIIDKYLG